MAFYGSGKFIVNTATGGLEVSCEDLKTWVLGADLGPVVTPNVTAYAVRAANSGRIHSVPDLTATCTFTLPVPASGLNYTFWYGGAAADAQDWVIDTGSASNYYVGGVVFLDQDTDVIAPLYSNGTSHKAITVVKPEVGTEIRVWSDGTVWYLNGRVHSITIPSIA